MDQRIGQLRCGECDAVFNNQSSLSRHSKIHWAALRCARDGCEKSFSSHKHLSKHLNRHSDTILIVRIVPFNIRTKVEIKQELNDDDVSGGSPSVPHFIIKKEEEKGEFKVKIEVKDKPTEKCNVQLCKRVKKENNDEDETWDGDECDCDECRVERIIKQEHDQTSEKEIDRNNGQANRDCVKDKKEEEEYAGSVNIEVKRLNKKQRIDKMTEEEDPVPLGTSTFLQTGQPSNNTKLEDDRVDQIDETDDENEGEQERDDGELLTNGQIDDDKLNVNDGEDDDDDTEVDEEYDENYDELSENELMDAGEVDEEDEDTEMDEESEQNESDSNGQLVQKNFVKRIEPDELGNRFECDYEGCGKRCKKNSDLIRHIRIHTGEKPFKCSWDNCCQAFNRKDSLKEHINTHTGNCPFDCTWPGCNADFKHRANLKWHTRIHLNDRRRRCDWPGCVQAFTDSSHLKVHRLIHTKERRITCNQCGVAFTRKTRLNKHYRRKHPD